MKCKCGNPAKIGEPKCQCWTCWQKEKYGEVRFETKDEKIILERKNDGTDGNETCNMDRAAGVQVAVQEGHD